MKRFFRNLFASNSPTTKTFNKNKFRPLVDALEQRLALNGDFTTPADPTDDMADIKDDVLYIRGTDQNDLITLEIDQDDSNEVRVTVFNWNLEELDSDDFDIDDFDRIEIRGFGGRDYIMNMTELDTFMFGGEDRDYLYSGGGDDVMAGNEGHDYYYFQHEMQSFKFTGVDYYFANLGSDTIVEEANEGTDRLRMRDLEGGMNLDLSNSNLQTVSAGRLNLTLRNEANQLSEIETVYGTDFADFIKGNGLANYLYSYNGNDTLIGGAGDDYLSAGYDNDTLEGQGGDDYLYGYRGDDTYIFNNLEVSNLGTDDVRDYSNYGKDTLDFSGMTLDLYQMGINLDLEITSDQDLDYGFYSPFSLDLNLWTSEIENVKATQGYDVVKGNNLDNHIVTYGLGDNLEGRAGNDTLEGGAGNDSYIFNNQEETNLGQDSVVEAGNADTDRLNFYNMDRGITVDLATTGSQTVASGVLQLTLSNSTGIENVSGSQFGDYIYGNNRDNNIAAYDGDDWVFGYNGEDYLNGMDGSDRLYGGNNNDTLSGGNHDDFLYGEGGLDYLYGGDGVDYLNGDYLNHYVSDGYNDQLYGYTAYSNTDGDRDMFVHHRRYVYNGWYYTSVDAGWETLAGFNSSEDIRHYYYSWNF